MTKRLSLIAFVVATLAFCSSAVEGRKTVVCWGDSLTAPHEGCYPDFLASLLGSGFNVVNCGVGGENTLTIMARQGAYPMVLAHDITVFRTKDAAYPKFIGCTDVPAFISTYDSSTVVTPLIQGGWESTGPAGINPCSIDGKEFNIRSEAHFWTERGFRFEYNYFLESTLEVENTFTLKKGSVVETAAMRELRGAWANVFFMGQNGGFKSPEDLVAQYKAMIEYSGCDRYVIVGYHVPNSATPTVGELKEVEKAMESAFGRHFVNNREYLVRHGLKMAGLRPTDEDRKAAREGRVPPQLMTDGVHFTKAAYGILAGEIADRFRKLGYN